MSEKIEHRGVIFRIRDGKTWVKIVQTSACSGCHAKSVCNVSEQKEKLIEVSNTDDSIEEGDEVYVIGEASWGLWAVFYVFIIPLCVVLVTLVLSSMFMPEKITVFYALLSLVLYSGVIYMFRDKFKKKFVFTIEKRKESEE